MWNAVKTGQVKPSSIRSEHALKKRDYLMSNPLSVLEPLALIILHPMYKQLSPALLNQRMEIAGVIITILDHSNTGFLLPKFLVNQPASVTRPPLPYNQSVPGHHLGSTVTPPQAPEHAPHIHAA